MAADDMPDLAVQGGPGLHQGHAQAAELQGIRLPADTARGRGRAKPERREWEFRAEWCRCLLFADPFQNLRSAEEMEEEERAAQSAKLQELIRRGGPQDLQEANRLMKIMAGYDTRNKTDYRAKAAEEVSKVQQKAKILEEMLQASNPTQGLNEADVAEVWTGSRAVAMCEF